MAHPILWHFPISHFNEKVRWALDYKRIPHVRRALFLGYLPRALLRTGQPSLPILILDGTAIADSTRIIAALEERKPDPPLYPADSAERGRALALEDFFDEHLGPGLRTFVIGTLLSRDPDASIATLGLGQGRTAQRVARAIFPAFRTLYEFRHKITPAGIEAGRSAIDGAVDRIEQEIRPSGYLAGDRFSVADLTAAALLSPLMRPPELEYPPPGPIPDWLVQYRDTLIHRPGFQWVATIYQRHRGASMEVRRP